MANVTASETMAKTKLILIIVKADSLQMGIFYRYRVAHPAEISFNHLHVFIAYQLFVKINARATMETIR